MLPTHPVLTAVFSYGGVHILIRFILRSSNTYTHQVNAGLVSLNLFDGTSSSDVPHSPSILDNGMFTFLFILILIIYYFSQVRCRVTI